MVNFINICMNYLSDLFSFEFFRYPIYVMFCVGVLFLIIYIVRGKVNG